MTVPGFTQSTRRTFLWRLGGGLGGIALASLLRSDGLLAGAEATDRKRPAAPPSVGAHHRPRAKRVVQFYMSGAASQCDLFDYKPELIKRNGQRWDPGEAVELFQSSPGNCMQSPWGWTPRGECGKRISDVLPHIGGCVDDIAFVHSMVAKSNIHGPATLMQATGFVLPGFPSMGAWISYGLGRETDDLPAFVVLPDSRGFAPCGPQNWQAGFLPAAHQGTTIRPHAPNPIADLFAPTDGYVTGTSEKAGLDVLAKLNRRHADERPGDTRLDARIASYEMAARLQLSAPEVLNLSGETERTQREYGMQDDVTKEFGRNCLVARRLLERGVRFLQIWSGADNGFPRRNWDSHEDIARDHGVLATSIDRPIAAFIRDLKRRGLLDETIILWTTEFGRMPCSQGSKGRDHNPFGFTNWLCGGGIKGGVSYGATDEWSYKAVEKPTLCYDVHATILHLLGLDHERLTFRHNGIDRRLTDVHGEVIRDVIA